MSLLSIAAAMDLATGDLEELISGHVPLRVAARTGILRGSLQEFLDGKANFLAASLVHSTSPDAQELRNKLGKEGAIGLVIGYLLAKGK